MGVVVAVGAVLTVTGDACIREDEQFDCSEETTNLLGVSLLQKRLTLDAASRGSVPGSHGVHGVQPVLYLHFHKAAGTSMCYHLSDNAKLRTPSPQVDNCNCYWLIPLLLDVSVQAHFIEEEMRRRSLDMCGLEVADLPPPAHVARVLGNWTGNTATMLRDPWRRFRSNFIWDQARHKNGSVKEMTVEEYARKANSGEDEDMWGAYSKPNYYVRMLNGLGFDPSVELTEQHLAAAIAVLRAFDYVFVLEHMSEERRALADFSGTSADFPHYLSSHSRHGPVDHYAPQFWEANGLDLALYQEALRLAGVPAVA